MAEFPNFTFEKKLWSDGIRFVAGIDEVGRGCIAGPVVAGCVVFAPEIKIPTNVYINDSKKLTPKRRKESSLWIKESALCWATGEASVAEVNRYGIGKATLKAFRRAVALASDIEFLLIDAFYMPYTKDFPIDRTSSKSARQKAIIKGDTKSLSIAAASIIAKVERDGLMEKLGKKFEKYNWSKNKGYGTKEHREAILKYGITNYHRTQFVETFLNKSASSRVQ